MNVLLLFYKYIYIRNTTLLPVFTSSCLESLIQFWSSLYLPPQQIPKRFQNTIRNTYKYGTKGKIRKFVRRSVQKIYMGIKMVERLNISSMQFINQISKPSRPRRRCMIKRKYGKTDGPRIGANFLPSPWYNNNFQSS